jgi:hypothetical protein
LRACESQFKKKKKEHDNGMRNLSIQELMRRRKEKTKREKMRANDGEDSFERVWVALYRDTHPASPPNITSEISSFPV